MITEEAVDERARIERTYRAYDADAAWSARYRSDDPANRKMVATMRSTYDRVGRPLPVTGRVLDLGCGAGTAIARHVVSRWVASGDVTLLGADLLEFRLAGLGAPYAGRAAADAARLPYVGGSFDAVVCSTLFSSVLDPELRAAIAAEIARVVRPEGFIAWYDMRRPNPRNRNVVPIGRAELRRLFPGFALHLRSTTVLPPLARRLPWAYGALDRAGALHSHFVGVIARAGTA